MKQRQIGCLIGGLMIIAAICGADYAFRPERSTYPPASDLPISRFGTIPRNTTELFNIAGYVMRRTECPVCPPGAQCGLCLSYVTVTASLPPGSGNQLIIFMDRPAQLNDDTRYLFTVRGDDDVVTPAGDPTLRLVGYSASQ